MLAMKLCLNYKRRQSKKVNQAMIVQKKAIYFDVRKTMSTPSIYLVTQKLPQIYIANYATFPIQIRKIAVHICGNFWVSIYSRVNKLPPTLYTEYFENISFHHSLSLSLSFPSSTSFILFYLYF